MLTWAVNSYLPALVAEHFRDYDIYYQIDINDGNGWNGSWKDLTAANLSAETIDPALGFKLKIRIVCDTTASDNLVSYIRIETVSTLVAQTGNLYPLTETDAGPMTSRSSFIIWAALSDMFLKTFSLRSSEAAASAS